MQNKIKVSVIIPVYNAGKYLCQCLDSVVGQTLKGIEVVCVNDGSTDNSLNVLKNYQKKYGNIKIVDQKNGGVIAARIAGYKVATGEYISWVDADDFADKEMLSKLYEAAIKNDADVVYCNYNFYPSEVINKQKWFNKYNGVVNWKFVMNNTVQWNKIVKKELLDQLDITKLFEIIGEGCYGLVLINAKNIIAIDECLYNYRVGHTSLSSDFKNVKWYKKVAERSLNLFNYVKENNYDKSWIDYYNYRYLYYNLILMLVSAYSNDKETYIFSKKIVKNQKLFSKMNYKYLNQSFSKIRLLFLRVGIQSYPLMRIMTKVVFR